MSLLSENDDWCHSLIFLSCLFNSEIGLSEREVRLNSRKKNRTKNKSNLVAANIDDEHPESPKPPKKKKKITGPLLTKDEICISNGVEEADQSESVESTKKEENQASLAVSIDGEHPECPKPSK